MNTTVVVQSPLDRREHGSGVVVGRNRAGDLLVLTARHVAMMRPAEVLFSDGGIAPVIGRVVQAASARAFAGDVAVLVIPDIPRASIAELATTDARIGNQLHVVGNPEYQRFQSANAKATQLLRVRWFGEASDLAVDSPALQKSGHAFMSLAMACKSCAPGDSGAGVFDEGGHLVGIMYGMSYFGPSRSFAVPISEIRPLLAAAR